MAFLDDILYACLRDWCGLFITGKKTPGNFLHRQESLSDGAVINKAGFQAWFNPGHYAFVNITFFLLKAGGFDIEVNQPLAINDGDSQLF
jgi:hypothetical protein